jgi:ADP-ribose pyrophosphatase YjhB (NUDIX family)
MVGAERMEALFCSFCGAATRVATPAGDHLPRRICTRCAIVHYENPRIVVGCVPQFEDQLLICRRAIEPRRGFWTVPAGFMENGESLEAGAARECFEEAQASVEIGSLLALVSIPEAQQVHVFFRARLPTATFGAGIESLEVKLVRPAQIPWDEIAFPSTRFALERFLQDQSEGRESPHLTTLTRRHPG